MGQFLKLFHQWQTFTKQMFIGVPHIDPTTPLNLLLVKISWSNLTFRHLFYPHKASHRQTFSVIFI